MTIPIFVIVRDRFEQLRRTVSRLEQAEDIDIVLVDNASTYEPTVDFLKNSPHQVIWLEENRGHHGPWDLELVPKQSPFGLTDPDIEPLEECPNDWPARMLDAANRHPHLLKVGFGLYLKDIPDHYFAKNHVLAHEDQFWNKVMETWSDGTVLYDADIDTTLAIYPRDVGWEVQPSARTGFPYVARHLAWYVDSNNLTEDEIYYRTHADRVIASWRYREGL